MEYPDEWQLIAARKVEYPPPTMVTAPSDGWQLLSSGEVEVPDDDVGNEFDVDEFDGDEPVPMTRRPGGSWDWLRRWDVRQQSGWNTASRVFDSLSPRVRTWLLWGGAAVLTIFFIALLLGW